MATGRVPTTANSPLTAKGDLFGYSTTQARVAVGNDGETLVADSSASTGLRYTGNYAAGKNKIINGDFNINQRAFTSATAGGYGFDRFANQISGSTGTATFSTQTFTPGTAPVAGYEGSNYLRIVTTGQTATSTITRVEQAIEDVRTFAGQTATFSFWAKAASGTPSVSLELSQGYGSGGSPSSQINIVGGNVTLSTSWARYSVTVAVPSLSGKTLGTTANTSTLIVRLWVSAGSDFNARTGSLGIQTNTFEFWGVQAEAGSVATAFQTATGTLQGELSACQRYYVRTSGSIYTRHGIALAFSTTGATVISSIPVTMRTDPSIAYSNTAYWNGTTFSANTGSASGIQGTNRLVYFDLSVASGLVAGSSYQMLNNNNAAGFLEFSAEL
jgi:hypothetical protein